MTDVQAANEPELENADSVRPGAPPTRRTVLAGAGALGATVVLAACGTDNTGSGTPAPEPPAGSATAGSGSGTVLASTSEVSVGGGIIKGDYVITQPSEGEFRAFTKICTHQGCPVSEVSGGTINCKCHGSQFSIEDGSVKGGPAPAALAQTEVEVDGDNVVRA